MWYCGDEKVGFRYEVSFDEISYHRLAVPCCDSAAAAAAAAVATMAENLPPDWEAVTADDGRVYYWNVETNETSCKWDADERFSIHIEPFTFALLRRVQGWCRNSPRRRRRLPPDTLRQCRCAIASDDVSSCNLCHRRHRLITYRRASPRCDSILGPSRKILDPPAAEARQKSSRNSGPVAAAGVSPT